MERNEEYFKWNGSDAQVKWATEIKNKSLKLSEYIVLLEDCEIVKNVYEVFYLNLKNNFDYKYFIDNRDNVELDIYSKICQFIRSDMKKVPAQYLYFNEHQYLVDRGEKNES